MRKGYEEILHNAAQEVDYVADFLEELTLVEETRKLWRAWSGILDHYAKAVSAMRRATDQGKSKGWSDKFLADQKNDPVLQYAFQSRDHASHVFEGKREANPRTVSVGGLVSLSGNSSVTLSNNVMVGADGSTRKLPDGTLDTKDGRYVGGSIPKWAVNEREHFVILKDVKTRSGVWSIPNPSTHPSKQAIEIAEHINDWLKAKLSEANEIAKLEKPR
ncbi:hypothetical protein [Neptunicoccus cionae]|uniref:Uncharacterized protein n=1 Tax=Neptunicoccus cionae TaxID=2035344 RepID=A0A916QTS9_9RHOB|nr:hypothetical protein [Amylibacter cionae]GGA09340.1 hypothetical protein GCM10011498_06580 [Amylibacter cionae]